MGSERRLKPSPFAGLLGLGSGVFFGCSLAGLYLASAGYQITVIQQHLFEQVQKQVPVRDLVNDPRFKLIMTGDDATTKLILASASSLEDEANSGDLESAFSNLEKRKPAMVGEQHSAELMEQILAGYKSWQGAKQAAVDSQVHREQAGTEREKIVAEYKMLKEDVQSIFQSKSGPEAAAEASADPDDPFNVYSKGLLAGIPRVHGVPDDIQDDQQIAGLLKQPVDTSEPPSVKVERIRQSMTEIKSKFDKASEAADAADEQVDEQTKKAEGLKTRLRLDLFSLLAQSHRTGIDNGALTVYQQISRLGV